MSIKDELADIFDIPTDGSNIKREKLNEEPDMAYAEAISDDEGVDFSEKLNSIKNSIEKVDIEDINLTNEIDENENQNNEILNETKENNSSGLEQILSESLAGEISKEDNNKQVDIEQENNINNEKEQKMNNKFNWKLSCDDELFRDFYTEKKNMLPYMLNGGEIPFDMFEKELKEAYVPLNDNDRYDLDELAHKMQKIQNWRNRVCEIQVRLNGQYYMWKRFIDMFRGILARAKYDKPALKQEGIVYDHMQDLELYFAKLESLVKSSDMISKNLESAFDSISRQVTIVMPNNREIERKVRNDDKSSSPNKMHNEFDSLDDLGDLDKVNDDDDKDTNPIKSSSDDEDDFDSWSDLNL